MKPTEGMTMIQKMTKFIYGFILTLALFGYKIEANAQSYMMETHFYLTAQNLYEELRGVKTEEQQRKEWQEEYDMHHYNAVRTYQNAIEKGWWYPNLKKRELFRKGLICSGAIISAAGPLTAAPTIRITAAIITCLVQYGLDCCDAYEYIEDQLYWCDFHLQKCAEYAELLEKG
jgi:hypothetical protein